MAQFVRAYESGDLVAAIAPKPLAGSGRAGSLP
jgi:hypothetical protein